MPESPRKFEIRKIIQETPEVRTYHLYPIDGRPFSFIAGQFVMLHTLDAAGNSTDSRAYSISSSPNTKDHIEFTIRHTDGFPSKIEALPAGSIVGVTGPFGTFVFEPLPDLVFIGGGVGVAGVMSAIRYALETKAKSNITLFYSTKTEDEVIWHDMLAEMQKEHKNLHLVMTLTREQPEGWMNKPCHEQGRIDSCMLKRHIGKPEKAIYYICGSLDMVAAIEAELEVMGIPKGQIRAERWGARID